MIVKYTVFGFLISELLLRIEVDMIGEAEPITLTQNSCNIFPILTSLFILAENFNLKEKNDY